MLGILLFLRKQNPLLRLRLYTAACIHPLYISQEAFFQDVLAVYVLRVQDGDSGKAIHLDAEAKEELEKIFFFMNVRRDSIITKKLSKEVDLETLDGSPHLVSQPIA